MYGNVEVEGLEHLDRHLLLSCSGQAGVQASPYSIVYIDTLPCPRDKVGQHDETWRRKEKKLLINFVGC